MKQSLTCLTLLFLFAECNKNNKGPVLPNNQLPVRQKQEACDFSSSRPQVIAQLIPVGTLSQARVGMAVASAGTKILFAGAGPPPGTWGANYTSSTVDIYDIATQTWSTTQLSIARSHIAAVAAGNKVFLPAG